MLPADPSMPFVMAFWALVVVMVTGFIAASWVAWSAGGGEPARARRNALITAAVVLAWVTLTGSLAASEVLLFGPMPPPMMVLVNVMFVGLFITAFSPFGARLALNLPLWFLVGFQSFRVFVELLLHQGYVEGLMPVEMSYYGWNFDVVTGVTAIAVGAGLYARRVPLWLTLLWNVMGLALLLTIVVISILATPVFEVLQTNPPNVWVSHLPFVWLPTVHVALALLGHLLVFRRLRHEWKSLPVEVPEAQPA